jgi:hypothetical protein
MKRSIIKLLVPTYLFILSFQACKTPPVIPVNPPLPFPITDIEQTPFHSFIDSMLAVYNNGILFDINPVTFGQIIEVAYSFHSSAPGNVTSLGVMLPASAFGFTHTVYLWDAETQALLVKADVPSVDSGRFTYVSLALAGEAIHIPANHEYYIGFVNTANEINDGSGNSVYELRGIFTSAKDPFPGLPIIPFTYRSITFDDLYQLYHDPGGLDRFPRSPGPGDLVAGSCTGCPTGSPAGASDVNGVCDIGFIPDN